VQQPPVSSQKLHGLHLHPVEYTLYTTTEHCTTLNYNVDCSATKCSSVHHAKQLMVLHQTALHCTYTSFYGW